MMAKIKKTKEEIQSIKIQTKNILLTYEHIPKVIKEDDLLKKLKELVEIEEYIIAIELHEDGEPHAHIFLNLKKRLNRKIDYLGLVFDDNKIIPNYRIPKTRKDYVKMFAYPLKEGNYITNIELNVKEKRRMTPSERLFIRSQEIGINKALLEYRDEHPDLAMKNFSSLYNNLTKMKMIENRTLFNKTKYVPLIETNISEHPIYPIIQRYLAYAEKNPKEVPDTIFVGNSGTGKSTLAVSMLIYVLKELSKENLVNNNIEYLETIDIEQVPYLITDSHDGIIVNESNVHKKCPTNIDKVKLHQGAHNSGIRVLYGFFTFKPGMIKMFTSKDLVEHLGKFPDLQVLRRIIIFPILPRLEINWNWENDPKSLSTIIIPENLKEEVKTAHYLYDPEFIKWNCKVIINNFPEIQIPEQELISENIFSKEELEILKKTK